MEWLFKSRTEQDSFGKLEKKDKSLKTGKQNLNFLKRKNINLYKVYFLFTLLELIQMGLNLSFSKKETFTRMQCYLNEITIKISGIGNQYVVNKYFYKCPDYIYLNSVLTNSIEGSCNMINIPSEGETTNNILLGWNDKLISLHGMFSQFTHLLEADFSNFDGSSVTLMSDLFVNCSSITSINLSGLNTTLVETMQNTFYHCYSLIELDLSSFDTSKVTTMSFTFTGCWYLISLNIRNFDTSQVENMEAMFAELYSLETLDVSHFDTSKVTLMSFMFYDSRKLSSLDLRNFNTSSVNNMTMMFWDDYSLRFPRCNKF